MRDHSVPDEPGKDSEVTYKLSPLASGSYDVLLDGAIIASLVRSGEIDNATWTAELLEDAPSWRRPAPFTEIEHTFRSFEEARKWLGDAEVSNVGAGA